MRKDGACCANCKHFKHNVVINGKCEMWCEKNKKVVNEKDDCKNYQEFKGYRE